MSERTYTCECCGLVLDRDVNAACNVLHEALRTTASSAGSHACGERSAGVFNGTRETALAEAGTNHRDGVSINV